MNLEQLQRAKTLEACINIANENIKHLEQLKDCKEIMIVTNTSEAKEAIKGIYYDSSKGNLAPMYYTGDIKDKMIDVAIEANKVSRSYNSRELAEL